MALWYCKISNSFLDQLLVLAVRIFLLTRVGNPAYLSSIPYFSSQNCYYWFSNVLLRLTHGACWAELKCDRILGEGFRPVACQNSQTQNVFSLTSSHRCTRLHTLQCRASPAIGGSLRHPFHKCKQFLMSNLRFFGADMTPLYRVVSSISTSVLVSRSAEGCRSGNSCLGHGFLSQVG